MITLTLVAILGVLLVIVLMQLFKKSPTPPARSGPVEDLANLKVTDARPGDILSISGAGDKMTDLDFTADRGTRFEAGSHSWLELSGPYLERRVALRVGGDEEVEVLVHNDPRKLTLEDAGLSEDDLAQMDERQNPADSFEFDGVTWMYRMSREVQARRDNQPQATGSYYWEFRDPEGRQLLAVRKPEGEPFTVTLYRAIPAADVTVYRGGRG
jgi:hypothetical protein